MDRTSSRCHFPFLPGLRNVQSLTLVQSKLSQAFSSSFTAANFSWHLTQPRQGNHSTLKTILPSSLSTSNRYQPPSPSVCLPYISLYPLLPCLSLPHYASLWSTLFLVSICLCQSIFCCFSISLSLSAPSSLPYAAYHTSVDENLWKDAVIALWGIACISLRTFLYSKTAFYSTGGRCWSWRLFISECTFADGETLQRITLGWDGGSINTDIFLSTPITLNIVEHQERKEQWGTCR